MAIYIAHSVFGISFDEGRSRLGLAGHAGRLLVWPMAKIATPKLLDNPVLDPSAKKLVRKRLIERAINIDRERKARKAAKKRDSKAPQTP